MAKIFSAAPEIKLPKFDWNKSREEREAEDQRYIDEMAAFIKSKGFQCKDCGKTVKFQYADGYARYMVITMAPLALMHIPLGDAWDLPRANKLTAKDIKAKWSFENMFKK